MRRTISSGNWCGGPSARAIGAADHQPGQLVPRTISQGNWCGGPSARAIRAADPSARAIRAADHQPGQLVADHAADHQPGQLVQRTISQGNWCGGPSARAIGAADRSASVCQMEVEESGSFCFPKVPPAILPAFLHNIFFAKRRTRKIRVHF